MATATGIAFTICFSLVCSLGLLGLFNLRCEAEGEAEEEGEEEEGGGGEWRGCKVKRI